MGEDSEFGARACLRSFGMDTEQKRDGWKMVYDQSE
jgi:hypothetical protein